MTIIKKLSPQEAQKIAAGETVERPFNVVKELVENALDASATHIVICITDGGKKMIRVTDNGVGMDSEDARACFERHATSKITHCDDLDTLDTFGFRGEALASIAAVSKTTLLTRQAGAPHACKIVMDYGVCAQETIAAAPVGTDFLVEDMFANIPARKKFLKQKETEYRHILQYVHATCMSNPMVHITLQNESTTMINCPPVAHAVDRFSQLWGFSDATTIESSTSKDGMITVSGALVPTQRYRYDQQGIFIFVNNRWIRNYKINNAIFKGYGPHLPPGKYPYVIISITLPPNMVDVNIHPRKEEVLLQPQRQVEQLVEHAVKATLEQQTSNAIRVQPLGYMSSSQEPTVSAFPVNRPAHAYVPYDFGAPVEQSADALLLKNPIHEHKAPSSYYSTPHTPFMTPPSVHSSTDEYRYNAKIFNNDAPHSFEQILAVEKNKIEGVIIGQYHKTYILIEREDGLYLVDQHAAHERILYESYATVADTMEPISLLFPISLSFAAPDIIDTLISYQSLFAAYHIVFEQQAPTTIIITALPPSINKAVSVESIFHDALSWIKEYSTLEKDEMMRVVHEKLRAQLACKAAVKAGDVLTVEMMQSLIEDLAHTNNRFMCPHGRPTGYLIPLLEIEKKFRRKT